MKYAINRIQYIEGPREAEFQIWRIIMQVGASYMRKSESTHFLPFSLVALYVVQHQHHFQHTGPRIQYIRRPLPTFSSSMRRRN